MQEIDEKKRTTFQITSKNDGAWCAHTCIVVGEDHIPRCGSCGEIFSLIIAREAKDLEQLEQKHRAEDFWRLEDAHLHNWEYLDHKRRRCKICGMVDMYYHETFTSVC
jgi:hypothetical protein